MKGEHKGDFSRDTFDPRKHFLRVLMQQGRVSLDADWNEQVDVLLHYIQTLAKDIIGPFAGPAGKDLGFSIKQANNTFNIGYGRYYVDGILCENEKKVPCGSSEETNPIAYYDQHQRNYPIDIKNFPLPDFPRLIYLDVWERHISYVEDDDIREKALGGPDTASRSKVIWQVKVLNHSGLTNENIRNIWDSEVKPLLQPLNRGCLKAQANKPTDGTDVCITSPKARYRGEENQLYRVEIHRMGEALKIVNGSMVNADQAATFKWSRDNGSVIFPILDIDDRTITLEHLGRDDRLRLKVGDWVEIIDDSYTLLIQSRPFPNDKFEFWLRPLAQVDAVDLTERKVTLKLKKDYALPKFEEIKEKHPFLRRWDYHEPDPTKQDEPKFADEGYSALFVQEGGTNTDTWLTLENGVQICFLPSKSNPNMYQAGDYWLIPARTATGDVEWPYTIPEGQKKENKIPIALPPHGIDHHYAPLAVWENAGDEPKDCRCEIEIRTTCNG